MLGSSTSSRPEDSARYAATNRQVVVSKASWPYWLLLVASTSERNILDDHENALTTQLDPKAGASTTEADDLKRVAKQQVEHARQFASTVMSHDSKDRDKL